jgi:hypothetical protein
MAEFFKMTKNKFSFLFCFLVVVFEMLFGDAQQLATKIIEKAKWLVLFFNRFSHADVALWLLQDVFKKHRRIPFEIDENTTWKIRATILNISAILKNHSF